MNWSAAHTRSLYNLVRWGEGYFDVSDDGSLLVRPDHGVSDAAIDMRALAERIRASGLRWPVLVRCSGILRDRIDRLCDAFARARQAHGYQGGYTAAYPIKVNQQFSVVSEILRHGADRVGLEAGSKPELMAVLGLAPPGGLVICNGYKDREYVRLGLIGRRLGQRLYLVIEKLSELELVIEQARELRVTPLLGVRVRLASIGAGKWQNTGGEKSKFGLHAAQVLELVERLREAGLLDSLQLLHFHLGSQLANLRDIETGVQEAVRFYAELHALGVPLTVMDVGGGLGVDYEGTGTRSFCSMNYGVQQYADTIVRAIHALCVERDLPHPELITESGRAMTAHHAFLITNVTDVERGTGRPPDTAGGQDAAAVQRLADLLEQADSGSPLEIYHDARHAMDAVIGDYSAGRLTLAQRARAEALFTDICVQVRGRLQPRLRDHRELLDSLNEKLADKYFCNLSVFQSVPDVWAIDQIFPIVPLQRLDEQPERRAILQDLTCDSDGHIEYYVDGDGVETSLPIHAVRPGEEYLLGIFLVGAYQEILGDMHNLFGDTDAVNLEVNADGSFRLCDAEQGDRVDELLNYVHFDPAQLRDAYRDKIERAGLTGAEAARALDELEAGLTGYTYLED